MKRTVMSIGMAVMFFHVAAAQQQPPTSIPQREIVVSLEDRKLALIENGQVTKIYTVAVGKPSSPSPEGTFTIERRVANPTYHHDGKTVLPGPGNPVGTRWMGLNKHGYGIHGTNEPQSIGKASSHGCIRMARPDLEEFYAMVAVGDRVRLIGQRNEETAHLFTPDEARQPVILAAAPLPNMELIPMAMPAEFVATAAVGQASNTNTVTAAGTR
ncbi:MAG TPA: L,D-transpeptidase [Terracidiphilus sp.]